MVCTLRMGPGFCIYSFKISFHHKVDNHRDNKITFAAETPGMVERIWAEDFTRRDGKIKPGNAEHETER